MRSIFVSIILSIPIFSLAQPDPDDPILIDFSINEFCINTSNDTIDVVFEAQLSDSLSGVESVGLLYLSPNGFQSSMGMSLISGDSINGVYELTIPYDSTYIAGVYTYGLYATDYASNSLLYNVYNRDLQLAGFQDSLKIINIYSDAISPALANFEISESCINVLSNAVDVTFTAEVSDNLSGIQSVELINLEPNGLQYSTPLTLIFGDSLDGIYESTITFDNTDIDGLYTYGLYIKDNFNNSILYNVYYRELQANGYADSLKVINVLADDESPMLLNFNISETCIDIINGSSEITFIAEVSDDLSGVESVELQQLQPSGFQSSYGMELISGDSINGIYELKIIYDNTDPVGVYTYGLFFKDNFNNSTLYNVYNRDLVTEGYADSLHYLIPALELYSSALTFTQSNTGVIFENALGDCHKMTIDNNGNVEMNTVICDQVNTKAIIEKANIFIESHTSPIILKSSNGGEWKIEIANNGDIMLNQFIDNGINKNVIKGGDLYLDKFSDCSSNGIVVKSQNGNCWLLELNSNNLVEARTVSCP